MTRRERYRWVIDYYSKAMPRVSTELDYGSAFQLLCATMLSAQCTDKRVNMITPELFSHYPNAQTMAKATPEEIWPFVRSVSYPNSKAKHLVEMSQMIMEKFGGDVPEEMEQLVKLPGVGRKTANVIRAVAFGKSAIAVDTHVFRVSHRLGLVSKQATTPLKVEQELMKYIPNEVQADAHHWLLLHGRYICRSRQPKCGECPFEQFCPKELDGSRLH